MMTELSASVTAAELVRNFASCRDMASAAPLFITNHGRKTHVLLGAEAFIDILARSETQVQSDTPEATPDSLIGLADWIDEGLVICDRELRIIFANRVAHAVTRRPPLSLIDKPLAAALPEVVGTLFEVHARRTMIGSEPSAADIPSPFMPDAWLRLQCFPLGPRNVLIFRDITEDVQRHRMADVKEAILEAMSVHGEIGYVRLSIRGTIERIDRPFCEMLELPESRLMHVALTELVAVADRVNFRSTLETVLQGLGAREMFCQFLTNRGELARTRISIVQLHGAYGAEGAVILCTPLRQDAKSGD